MKRPVKAKPRPSEHAILAVLLASGCQRFPEVEYETEHLRIGTEFDAPLCQGNLDHYERVIALAEQQFDAKLDGKVELYLWDFGEDPARPDWCPGSYGTSCYRNGVIYTSLLSVDHELVHAVIESFANPGPFWSEGAAEAFQSSRTLFGESSPLSNLELDTPELSYLTAGHFSRWLVATYGVDKYRQLLRKRASAIAAFESTYDMAFEDAQEQYYQEALYSYGSLISCDSPLLPEIGELIWSETVEIDCANDHVIASPDAMGTYRTLTIEERGYYELSTSAEFGVIKRCQDQDLEQPIFVGDDEYGDVPPVTQYAVFEFSRVFGGEGGVSVIDLAPGQYELGFGHNDHEPHTATLQVRAAVGPIPQTPSSP